MTMLSITTDYVTGTGSPDPYLRRISEAGFSHIHWCHEWNTDFLYPDTEIERIGRLLAELQLQLLDLHGSSGPQRNWGSADEPIRAAGMELVRNRVAMAARLGSDVVIMHIPKGPDLSPLFKSLDELEPFVRSRGVRLAVENGHNHDGLKAVFARCSRDYVGLCWDSGHGNLEPGSLDWLDRAKDRLISIHLHDNDGATDQHKICFSGTVDWTRLIEIIAGSSYAKCISMEVSVRNSGIPDERVFLTATFDTGVRLARMLDFDRARLRRESAAAPESTGM